MPRKRIGKLQPGDYLIRRMLRIPASLVAWANDHGGLAYVTRELIKMQMKLEKKGKPAALPAVSREPKVRRPTKAEVLETVRENQKARRETLAQILGGYAILEQERPGYGTLCKRLRACGFVCSRATVHLDMKEFDREKGGEGE